MAAYLTSQRVQRAVLWLSVLLAVAGLVVFIGSRTNDGENLGASSLPPETAPAATPADPFAAETQPTAKDVPRAARIAAAQFILAAAGREDLPKAWRLAHPRLKQDCGCTYKEWLTGNINVDYYPVDNLDVASFAVQEARKSYVVLHVALLPGKGAKVKPQSFMIGLRPMRDAKTKKQKWLIDYWAPYASTPVPAGGEGNQ